MSLLNRRNILIGAAVAFAAALTAGALIAGGNGDENPVAAEATPVSADGMAPDFTAVDLEGRVRTLAEFRGRTVILEWTNKDCPYVRKHYNSGNMQETQRAAAAAGAVWLTVLSSAPGEQGFLDASGAAANLRAVNASPTAMLLDPEGVVGRAYGARTTPHMYIIDAEGRLVYQGAIDDRPTANPDSLEGATNFVLAALNDMQAGRAVQTPETTAYGCDIKYAT